MNWNESVPSPFIYPSEEDAAVAPYSNFPSAASIKGSPPNQYVGVPENAPRRPYIPNWEGSNWTSWVFNVSACALRRFPAHAPNTVAAVERWRHLLHARQCLVCIRDLGCVNAGRASAPASDRLKRGYERGWHCTYATNRVAGGLFRKFSSVIEEVTY